MNTTQKSSRPKVYIFGDGPSGLIAANHLKYCYEGMLEFEIISKKQDGFKLDTVSVNFKNNTFKVGQKTLFWDLDLSDFLSDIGITWHKSDMSDTVSVFFKNKLHKYPIQNNLKTLSFKDKWNFLCSYFFRKRNSNASNYQDWVRANYGNWMSDNILIPHTWKTLKHDLHDIDSASYGKKVVEFQWFGNNVVYEFDYPDEILRQLREKVKDHITEGNVEKIWIDEKYFDLKGVDHPNAYNFILNTIPIVKLDLHSKNKSMQEYIALTKFGLNYNNMFCGIFVVPTDLIQMNKQIIYFPERDYVFSKITIYKKEHHSIICCECSFRRNDEDKFHNKSYIEKFLNKIEDHLKKSGLVKDHIMATCHRTYHIVSPCYILTDFDYNVSNKAIQGICEDNMIFNIGRFAQWVPNLRVEHSYHRMCEIATEIDKWLSSMGIVRSAKK